MAYRLGRLHRIPAPCPACAGSATADYVIAPERHGGPAYPGRPIPCPECKGTGKAPSTPKAA
jgi:hypothetical protein